MTVRGMIFAVVEFLILTIALGTGIRELLVAAVCLGAILLYSLVSIIFAQITLSAYAQIDKSEIYRGQSIKCTLKIKGPVLLPVTAFLTVASPGAKRRDNGAFRRHAFSLAPALRMEREYLFTLKCKHRGYYKAGIRGFRVRDLFGLISLPLIRSRKQPLRFFITVFPNLHKIKNENPKISVSEGYADTQIKTANQGELLGDTRLYVAGDSLKRIHWKQSIRTKQLYTRQFEAQENPQVVVFFDAACKDEDRAGVADIITETAISLINHFVSKGKSVRFITVRNKYYTENEDMWIKSSNDIYVLLNKLAGISLSKDKEPLDLWQFKDAEFNNAGTVYVISNNPADELFKSLDAIRERDGAAVCFVAQKDEDNKKNNKEPLTFDSDSAVVLKSTKEISAKVGEAI